MKMKDSFFFCFEKKKEKYFLKYFFFFFENGFVFGLGLGLGEGNLLKKKNYLFISFLFFCFVILFEKEGLRQRKKGIPPSFSFLSHFLLFPNSFPSFIFSSHR